MNSIISDFYKNEDVKIISPNDDAHYFFAYYDMRATGNEGKHLAHRVSFIDRLPKADDLAEIGYLDGGRFYKFAQTTAWNFQQGAMLQYHPYLENTVYYNVCENGRFSTVTHNFITGQKKYTDRATACVSHDGKWGLAIDFGRIYDFRPGYGYAGFCDKYADICQPEDDGVFLVDMESGKSKLILNYKELGHVAGFKEDEKILVNHITFNRASDRFVMLVRNFKDGNGRWRTSMVIGDLDGNCHAILKNTYVSHYDWISGRELLAHCTIEGKKSMFRIDVVSEAWVEYDMPYFHIEGQNPDIHCNLSPNGNYIIGDGYDFRGYRAIMAYSLKTGKERTLLKVKTLKPSSIDVRCDLHARFVWGGRAISFDTTHHGKREIAVISPDALNF